MAGPLARALAAHMDSVFVGPNGDYPPLLEAINGLTAGQAVWKPSPASNSIWQIVDHLTASKVWGIEMFEKGTAAFPVWTEPSGDEAAWQRSVDQLKAAHGRLKNLIEGLQDAALLEFPAPELHQTFMELILSTACAHEAYHNGQIHYLRGLQGA